MRTTMMRRVGGGALVVIASLCNHTAGAQIPAALQYAGIQRSQFDYAYSEQHNSQWCWAASIQMILNYYGLAVSQEDIVRRSYGMDPYGQLPNWPGSWATITRNLNNWSIDDNGTRYRVRSMIGGGAPSPALLLRELAAQHPVLIAYMSTPNSGHAVVATAAGYAASAVGPIVHEIIVRDPWPSDANRANDGRVVYPGTALARVMTNYWLIEVVKDTQVPSGNRVPVTPRPIVPANGEPSNFSDALRTLVTAAEGDFSDIKGPFHGRVSGTRTYDVTVNLEGAKSCTLWDETPQRISCAMDTSRRDADDVYEDLIGSVKETLGDDWDYEGHGPSGTYVTTTRLTATNKSTGVIVTVSKLEYSSGNIDVSLRIRPPTEN